MEYKLWVTKIPSFSNKTLELKTEASSINGAFKLSKQFILSHGIHVILFKIILIIV